MTRAPTQTRTRPLDAVALAAAVALASACGNNGEGPRAEPLHDQLARGDSASATSAAHRPAPGGGADGGGATGPTSARDGQRPLGAPETTAADGEYEEACAVDPRVTLAPDWALVGFRPGPALHELLGHDRRRLIATTARRICTSDDGGEHWTERAVAAASPGEIELDAIDADEGRWLAVVRPAGRRDEAAPLTRVLFSTDGEAERWEPLAMPAGVSAARAAFSDGYGRLFVATDTRLFESRDLGASWSAARALPGTEAREVDACGAVMLVARGRADEDWFYHRSFDRGETWRPFRLGAIGLEGNNTVLRCITGRGGVEAGRAPLPSHWSWDGGRTWQPAEYDPPARTLARQLAEAPAPGNEAPHCMPGPGRMIACVDTGRLRLVRTGGNPGARARVQEIHAPSSCEHVRQIDARRSVAFGPACGLYLSTDRGGLWHMLSQSLAPRPRGEYAEGRGGFINARTAWRLDGGVWWTFDGGAHWRPFVSIGERDLDRGVFVDSRRGVFATRTGWVVATRDGGRSWTYVLRGEVERIATTRRTVVVTTTQSVRVSPDGGVTWLAAGALAPQRALDPTVEVVGQQRAVTVAPGTRVVQRGGTVSLESPEGAPRTLLDGIPPRFPLLAAHATGGQIDRVLLDGGVVLARTRAHATGERPASSASLRADRRGRARRRPRR